MYVLALTGFLFVLCVPRLSCQRSRRLRFRLPAVLTFCCPARLQVDEA
jgi:hypothetical protein